MSSFIYINNYLSDKSNENKMLLLSSLTDLSIYCDENILCFISKYLMHNNIKDDSLLICIKNKIMSKMNNLKRMQEHKSICNYNTTTVFLFYEKLIYLNIDSIIKSILCCIIFILFTGIIFIFIIILFKPSDFGSPLNLILIEITIFDFILYLLSLYTFIDIISFKKLKNRNLIKSPISKFKIKLI